MEIRIILQVLIPHQYYCYSLVITHIESKASELRVRLAAEGVNANTLRLEIFIVLNEDIIKINNRDRLKPTKNTLESRFFWSSLFLDATKDYLSSMY
jgi:hypothetical protein